MPRIRLLCCLTVILLAASATWGQNGPPSAPTAEEKVRLVPERIDFGLWGAGQTVTGSAWIINDSSRSIRLRDARGSGGLQVIDFKRRTLAPSQAFELKVALELPTTVGTNVHRTVAVTMDGHRPVVLFITATTDEPDIHRPPYDSDVDRSVPLRAAPFVVDLGEACPGERREGLVWLINGSDTPLTITNTRGSCGCLEIPRLAPLTIEPSQAVPVWLTMLAQGNAGDLRRKYASFLMDAHPPLTLPVDMQIIDPLRARIYRYHVARDEGDATAMRVLMAVNSPIYQGTLDGPALSRDFEGRGPWALWERELNTMRSYDGYRVEGRTVSVFVTEQNDFHRLLDRPARQSKVTYFFDDDDLIAQTLLEPVPPAAGATDRFPEFLTWARRHQPELLAQLYPGGKIVPTPEHARRWRSFLLEWRYESGLPDILLARPTGGSGE